MTNLIQITRKDKFYRLALLIVVLASLSSCISTKKVAYVDSMSKQTGVYTPQKWSYKIQKGDRFYIKIVDPMSQLSLGSSEVQSITNGQQANFFMQQPSLFDYVVKENGLVNLPIIGDIQLLGVELDSLPMYLEKNCEGYISNPEIHVFMMNYNVTVLGEVSRPGFYQLITDKPSFFDAVALAGDLTDFANRNQIQIQRKQADGKVLIENVDILDPSFINSPFYYVRPNDVIHVRPLKVKKYSVGNAFPLILSSITTILTIFTLARTF